MKLEEVAKQILLNPNAKENHAKWFGKSVLKHDDGTPMDFYHGTGKDFDTFSHEHVGKGEDAYGSGFYFANKPDTASHYAGTPDETNAPNVKKVHLRLEKPLDMDDETPFKRQHIEKLITSAPNHMDALSNFGDIKYHGYRRVLRDAVDGFADIPKYHAMNSLGNDFYRGHEGDLLTNIKKVTGHDGVIVKHDGHIIANVFHPNQIKSSISNSGVYSRRKNSINEAAIDYLDRTGNI